MFSLLKLKEKSGKRDSDPRPQPWQGCALPTELFSHYFYLLFEALSRAPFADAKVTILFYFTMIFFVKNLLL